MRPFLLLAAVAIFCSGCAAYNVQITRDDVEQTATYELKPDWFGQQLGGVGGFGSLDFLGLGAQEYVAKDGTTSYDLVVFYQSGANNWLYISSGPSLELLIDGQLETFSSQDGSSNNQNWTENWIREYAWFDCTLDDLKKIAGAKSIKAKVIGQNSYVEGFFVQNNFDDFKRFVADYGGTNTPPPAP